MPDRHEDLTDSVRQRRALVDDPRADRRMLAAMSPFQLGELVPPSPVTATSDIDDIMRLCADVEQAFEALNEQLNEPLPVVEGVEHHTVIVPRPDGSEIELFISKKSDCDDVLPAVVHLHGGAMVALSATGPGYRRWRDLLATAGVIAIGVEFRNAAGRLGDHPFPAGLDDCSTAINWIFDHRRELGASSLIVSGESGGANLALASALRAHRDGWSHRIAGVYAQCPFISNLYAQPDPALPSLMDNDGYLLGVDQLGALAVAYDPSGANARNSLAWPYHALTHELMGLPPHIISVNQLDPLRDEGLAYYSKLLDAGVPAASVTMNGLCHAGELLFAGAVPDAAMMQIRAIAAFCCSLDPSEPPV